MQPATIPAPPGARDRILDAAEQLVSAQGASNLTLDAVAQSAGVSKGGLLYHYPSKDALLVAMLERYCDQIDARCALARSGLVQDDGAGHLKSVVIGVLRSNAVRAEVGTALLAAAANNPSLLDPVRQRYAETVARLAAHPCSFPRAAIVTLAVDGLMMGEVWRLTSFTPEQREQIVSELLRLVDEAFAGTACSAAELPAATNQHA
jgi:AcrR family transcriptional regulator